MTKAGTGEILYGVQRRPFRRFDTNREAAPMPYLPWDQINAFLLHVGGATDRDDLFNRMLKGTGDIIPWDVGIGVFDRDIHCVACGGWDRRTFEHYNTHYYAKVPFILYDDRGVARRGKDVVQWGQMPDSEFIRDFARPLGLDYGLSPFRPAWPLNVSIQRSKDSPIARSWTCSTATSTIT